MALLGEMHYMPAGPDSFFSLPRSGGVAYAAQESWVQNETIRVSCCQSNHEPSLTLRKNNILFGSPFDEERYNKGRARWSTVQFN